MVSYTDRSFAAIKKDLLPRLASYPLDSKFIFYSNRRTKIEAMEAKLADLLDSKEEYSKLDIVCLVGTLTKEQKAHYINVFVNGSPAFRPRFLLATSGAANAGIDCDAVYGVYRIDFPPSLIDLCQEKGRAGRSFSATPDRFFYHILYSFETYLHLYKRIRDPTEDTLDEAYREAQLQDLHEVLRILVIPTLCFQHEFETRLSNPQFPPNGDEILPCGECTFCTGYSPIPSFHRPGMVRILFSLLVHGPHMLATPRLALTFVKSVSTFPKAASLLFRNTSRRPVPPKLVKQLCLGLLAAGILKFELVPIAAANANGIRHNEPVHDVVIDVALHAPGLFAMNDDTYWSSLPLLE